jgi:hypothetical protein
MSESDFARAVRTAKSDRVGKVAPSRAPFRWLRQATLPTLRLRRSYSHARLSTVFSYVAPGTVMFHLTVQL